MKTAIVTDFLNQFGGAEIVTREIASLFPGADIYTLMASQEVTDKYFSDYHVFEHPKMASSNWRRKHYRKLLPFYPTYIEDFNFKDYDLVISSSYLWSKGVLTRPGTLHISYIHTPIRQAWVKYHEYLNNENDIGAFAKILLRYIMNYIRIWDESSAKRVDYFIANSSTVHKRIKSIYRRDSEVIFPPIDVQKANLHNSLNRKDYYITVGRLVPYKRVDIMIRAFNEMPEKKLLILGDGNDMSRLSSLVKSDNIKLKGFVNEEDKWDLLSKARGFVFCAEEDFGMSPVEALSFGVPLIAFNKAGVRDYLIEGKNGIGFEKQTVDSLKNAITHFEQEKFDYTKVANTAQKFHISNFKDKFSKFVSHVINA